MTLQTINIGTVPNDGTGDPLRTAFTKINGNDSELYAGPISRFGAVAPRAPQIVTAATYSLDLGATPDYPIIANFAGTVTLTFPVGPATGREIIVKTVTNNTVVSASSNIIPLVGGAAGTAILAATAGKWARLMYDGTNWNIMEGN